MKAPHRDIKKEREKSTVLSDVETVLPTRGLHVHRLKTNPLEKLFADEWRIQQRVHTFAYLMNCNNKADYDSFTKRDSCVAATVIQWLGSPVGQGFLREVQRKTKDL